MSRDDDAHLMPVGDGQPTPEAPEHQHRDRAWAEVRWALHELRREQKTAVPPVPPELVDEIRRELAATAPAPPAPRAEVRTPAPLYVEPPESRPHGRMKVRALVAGLVTAVLVLGLAAVAMVGPTTVPAHADVHLVDKCTSALRQREPKQVIVAGVWASEERRRFRLVLDRFQAETGIEVVFASRDPDADRDLGHTLRALSNGDCAPGVALLPQPGVLRDLAREGMLLPVETIAGDEVDANYMPVWRDLATGDDGQLYGVWFKAANKSMIWYDAPTLARLGLTPPTDWEGLKRLARALRDRGIFPFSVAADHSAGWTLTDWFENIYLQTAGSALYDQLTRHEIPWDHPTVVTALDLMADILRPEWIAPNAAETTYEESVRHVFERHEAAMVFEADFVANEVAKTAANVGVEAKFFPFPSITGGMPTVVGSAEQVTSGEVGGDVAVLMQDTDEARALLAFLGRPAAAVPWAQLGGFLSPNRAFPASAYPDDATRAAAAALSGAKTVRFDLSDLQHAEFGSRPRSGLWSVLRDLVTGRQAPAASADRLEEAYCHTAPPDRATLCRR
jgi:alpha-glucoside transport system substrate-binding protein